MNRQDNLVPLGKFDLARHSRSLKKGLFPFVRARGQLDNRELAILFLCPGIAGNTWGDRGRRQADRRRRKAGLICEYATHVR